MDSVQKEHDRLWKQSQTSKTLSHIQEIIDALQTAKDDIATEPTSASVTLAKIHNPTKTSFESVNASLKEIYGGHNKYSKVVDKLFKDKPLPSNEIDALSPSPALVNRAIYLHLLREGLFDVATTLENESTAMTKVLEERALTENMDDAEAAPLGVREDEARKMHDQFKSMYGILKELREHHNLQPAIDWARDKDNTKALEIRGSNLEFELRRLVFVNLVLSDTAMDEGRSNTEGPQRALQYARKEFKAFSGRYLLEICQLAGGMAFYSNLEESPYKGIFNNRTAWDEVASSFTREFCALMELSADSPLYIAATAGAIALPTLLKLQNIMKEKKTEWTTENELPVEIPLPSSYQFHSIFVCPVSKEQTTDQNPPTMMPCGHVIAKESLDRLSKGGRFKCPYCPGESHPRDAKKVFL
jgi:E3 ubiquitin-protein transferase RMND5